MIHTVELVHLKRKGCREQFIRTLRDAMVKKANERELAKLPKEGNNKIFQDCTLNDRLAA
jgi:hypothetical protein